MNKLFIILLLLCSTALAADIRCCVEPKRYADGRLVRSVTVIAEFQRLYPLPLHLKRADFQINHSIPLVCGGRDIVENLTWMHVKAKTCAEDYCQDRHEQATMCPKSYHR
jgi:hypothetical protein